MTPKTQTHTPTPWYWDDNKEASIMHHDGAVRSIVIKLKMEVSTMDQFMRLRAYLAMDKAAKKTGWDKRHNDALRQPHGAEVGIVTLLDGLETYIAEYAVSYPDSVVFTDGVLGDGVADIARGIRTLLNGECGRLDAGTIDRRLVQILRTCGEQV